MVKLVQQTCYECGEPIVRTCERCTQWHARVLNWYAGGLDRELSDIINGFKPVPLVA